MILLARSFEQTIEKWFKFCGKYPLLDPFKDYDFNFPHQKSSKTVSSWLSKDYTVEDFCKVI